MVVWLRGSRIFSPLPRDCSPGASVVGPGLPAPYLGKVPEFNMFLTLWDEGPKAGAEGGEDDSPPNL